MTRFRNITLGASCFVLAAATLAACTLRFDFTECKASSDCATLESSGVFYMCEADQCVPDLAIQCRTDAHCEAIESCTAGKCTLNSNIGNNDADVPDANVPDMDTPDAPDTGPADRDGDGVADDIDNCPDNPNADQADLDGDDIGDVCDPDNRLPCANSVACDGDTNACIAGFCTEMTSEDCPIVIGEPKAAETLILGVILPMTAPYENLGPPLSKSIELALIEANRGGGLPNGQRVAAVVCNDVGNSTLAQRAARHLVTNLQVPGIIGPLFSTGFTDVVTQVTRNAGVLTITPAATAPSLTNLADDGLAFRLLASDVFQAKAIAKRIGEMVDAGSNSVTIFVKDDAYGNGLFSELSRELGPILPVNQRTSVKYTDPATFNFDLTQIQAEFMTKIGAALSARPNPDIAIFIGTSEVVNLALAFSGAIIQGGNPPPSLVFSHGAIADMPTIASDSNLGSTLNPITEGVGPNIFNGINFLNYNARFALEFPGEPNLTISTLTYDATAVMLFAAAAVPDGEAVTGRAMAANIAKIGDKMVGKEIKAGDATFLSEGFAELGAGRTFDFVGTSHDVDFDANGDVLHDFLKFVAIPAMPSGWTIGTTRVYPLGLGIWIDQCGMGRPACPAQFTCEPTNGICLPQCDQTAPACPHPALMCVEDGDFNDIGICVPPS